jgi:hypothetical protein
MDQSATQMDEPMFLYELAIELDVRSIELAADASRLGMVDVGPTSALTQEQVAALRAACGRVPIQPVVASSTSGPALSAPAGWGARSGPDRAAAPAPVAPPAPTPPAFDPSSAQPPPWGGLTTPAPPPPPSAVPALPPPPPPMAVPPTPPAGPAPFAPPVAPTGPPDPWSPPLLASSAVPTGLPERNSRLQLAAVGVVVLLVAGLFAYMTLHSGPDKAREAQLRAGDRRAAAEPTPTLTPTTGSEPTPTTVPEQTTVPDGGSTASNHAFADVGRFCTATHGAFAFELRVGASENDGDWRAVQQTIRDGQAGWRRSMSDMASGVAPYLAPDLEFYRSSYETMIGSVLKATSADEMRTAILQLTSSGVVQSAQRINTAFAANCRISQQVPSYGGGA